jgi:hypothetical protein
MTMRELNSNTVDGLAADELTLDALETISGGGDDLGADCGTMGAVGGAIVGSLGGPVGAVAGAVVGGVIGYCAGKTVQNITKATVLAK